MSRIPELQSHQPSDRFVHTRDMSVWLFLRPTCLALGLRHFPLPNPENETAGSPWPSLLPFIWSLAARTVINASGTADNSIAAFSSFADSSWVETLDRSLENRQLQLTSPPVHFARNPGGYAEFTSSFFVNAFRVCPLMTSRESTAVSTRV